MDLEDGGETVEDENGRMRHGLILITNDELSDMPDLHKRIAELTMQTEEYMEYKPAPSAMKEIRIKNAMEMENLRRLKEAQEDFENLSRLKKDMVKRKIKKLRRKYASTAS